MKTNLKYALTSLALSLGFFGSNCTQDSSLWREIQGGSSIKATIDKAKVSLLPQTNYSHAILEMNGEQDSQMRNPTAEEDSILETGSPKNLLENPNGDKGVSGWLIVKERGLREEKSKRTGKKGFYYQGKTFREWQGGEFFGTTRGWNIKRQVVNLEKIGISTSLLDEEMPPIHASEEFSKTWCGGDRYFLKVELWDANKKELVRKETRYKTLAGDCDWVDEWLKEQFIFTDYPKGVRYIEFMHGGKSKENLDGYYGTRMRNASVGLQFENKFADEPLILHDLQTKLATMSDNANEKVAVSLLLHRPQLNEYKQPNMSVVFEITGGEMTSAEISSSDADMVSNMQDMPSLESQVELLEKESSSILSETSKLRKKGSTKIMQTLEEETSIQLKERAGLIDDSTGLIEIDLTKAEINTLIKNEDLIQSIDVKEVATDSVDSAYRDTFMYTAHRVEADYVQQVGSGVGVYMREAYNACFDPNTFYFGKWIPGYLANVGGSHYWEDRPTAEHATLVAQSIKVMAPYSNLYCSDERYSLPRWLKDRVHIVNYSFGFESSEASSRWLNFDSALEKHVWNDRVAVFVAAGNGYNKGRPFVTSPGKAHNAITVGAYNDANDTMATFSDRDDPETGAIKPEIVAPGAFLRYPTSITADRTAVATWKHFTDSGSPINGTSFAAPLAAGMAASLTSRWPLLKKQPQLIKASMIAMSVKNIELRQDANANTNTDADGVGAIQWNENGYYAWWNYRNSFFPSNRGRKLLKKYYIPRKSKIRVVISWLNDYSVGCDELNKLAMDIELMVDGPNGRRIATSISDANNWEMVEFTAPQSGYYKVYAQLWRNGYKRPWYYLGLVKVYSRVNLGLRIAYIKSDHDFDGVRDDRDNFPTNPNRYNRQIR